MNDKSIVDRIESLAEQFVSGEVEAKEIWSLPIFEQYAVLSLGAVYSCTKIGTISPEKCAKTKFVILNRYEQFKTRTYFLEKSYEEWLRNTAVYSSKLSALAINIRENGLTAENFMFALEIVDLMTKQNVYLDMFRKRMEDPDFKKNAIKAASVDIDKYIERFGRSESYAKLIERFYTATDEEKVRELFDELSLERIRKRAQRVPMKSENTEVIADNLMNLYGKI